MFKRLFWLITGAGFGFGVSFWLMRFVRETAARFLPHRDPEHLAGGVRRLGDDLRASLAAGRQAMHDREAELRG